MYAVIWLQGGTRNMDWAHGWLESALNPTDAPYTISIGNVSIRWDSITDFGQLHVQNMRVSQKDGPIFATLPQVEITLDAFGFLPGRRALQGIHINRPQLFLTRDEQGVVRLGLQGVEQSLPLDVLLASFASDSAETEQTRGRLPFRALTLENAALTFTDAISHATLVSDPFSFSIRRKRYNMSGSLAMPFMYKDKPGSVDASLYTQSVGDDRILNARLENVPGDLACIFTACPEGANFTGNISGKITLRQSRDDGFSGDFSFSTAKATLTAPTLFTKALSIKKAGIIGRVANDFREIYADTVTLQFPDTSIGLKAMAAHTKAGWSVAGEGTAAALDMKKLHLYWPLGLAAETRAWVGEHITEGMAEQSSVKFDLRPEDLTSPVLRDAAIDSTVIAKNITVNYIPGFPPVTAMDGTVHFTGETMHIEASKGNVLKGTVVKSAVLDCEDLNNPRAPMTTTLMLTAPATDVATLLKLKPFTFDDGVGLNPATITGTVDATLKLGFNGFSEAPPTGAGDVDFSSVSYDVDAVLTNIAQPKLMEGRDISGLSGTLKANEAGVSFDGNVKLDGGTNVALGLKDEGGVTIATAKGTLARSKFAQFGIPEISQLGEGSVGVDAEISLVKEGTQLKRAVVDLTPIALNVPEISWSKKAGESASLSLTPSGAARSYGISVKAPDLTVSKASLQFNTAMDDVAALKLGRVKTSRNDFSMNYATTANGYDVTLSGAKLDHSVAFAQPGTGEGILANFPSIHLKVDLGALVLAEKYPLTNLKGSLNCNRTRCISADIRAQAGESTLDGSIATVNGQRQLVVKGSNAGDLLRAVDMSDRMFGGTLELKGAYDDTTQPAPFGGRLLIQRFTLKNSEILARIISIGSLSGLVNVLTGEGIEFKKMGADIQATAGVIKVKKGRVDSNALGLTLAGTANTAKRTLNMKGVVVPANSLNSLFGKIPLIGRLAGGEGEGLIAFNYSVKGSMADPEVFVNPLSGLTPGFLRGIFTLGDSDPTEEAAPEPNQIPKAENGEQKTPDITLPEPTKP